MMINRKHLLLIFFFATFLASCQDKEKERELAAREQQILDREKAFALKEADYQSLLKMRDSLLTKIDTTTIAIQQWPEEIAGAWSAKSVCRESNCSEYVIGDQRSNTWEFISDSTGLYTRVINNNQIVRVYSARFDSTSIYLQFKSDTSATKNMEISVDLKRENPTLLKGSQTTGIDKACTAQFSMELTRLNR
ncbi:hypothetical protein DYBT9623_00142 [Dyadobacter sp. CECT 9623]|uniref:Lipocalin-like domain-containing protein n=1 Tax=Dyadobacter linearis TaxID=2823330 RepID=A0ABM8UIX6_9BACT|nr:hypothetical protein [Dyadobacter sp. CECT 9623]CAG5067421.1 hypothetical protein DYBT9623_00142 [Dyadobacter sp. CECT 9623]